MMKLLTALICIALVGVASARIPMSFWNKLRTLQKTIDPRFPQYIVEPLLPCTTNSTFVHPRNCAWFYRCHLKIVPDYYHRAYFECAPGTSFNQTLGLCTLHSEDNCNGIPYNPTTLPTLPDESNSNPSSAEQPAKPPYIPDQSTTDESTCNDCYENIEVCNDYTVCPKTSSGTTKEMTLSLCKTAYRKCFPCEKEEQICGENEYYSMETKTCYPPPETMQCAAIRCEVDQEILVPSFVRDNFCKMEFDCNINGQIIRTYELCSKFVRCYYDATKTGDDKWSAKYNECEGDLQFDIESQTCMAVPNTCPLSIQ